jgi:tetratricopeptide (TPR) repeat protein
LTTLNAIDYWIGGKPEPDSFYFHVSIFISYVLLGILLYFLLLKLFNESFEHTWNKYFALFGSAFFCLHAANAETINYVIARSDSFSTLMIVLTMIIYLYKPKWRNKLIYLIPVAIGFFVKEPTVMVAPLLFVYILLFEKNNSIIKWFSSEGIKNGLAVLVRLIPLFILVILLFLLSKSMASKTFIPGGGPFYNYIITQPFVIVHYFNNFLLPLNLSADTDWMPLASIVDDRVIIGTLFILAMIGTAIYCSTKRMLLPISFGIIWFFLALLPTCVVSLSEVMNDHRTFFPYIGLAMAAAWTFALMIFKLQAVIEKNVAVKIIFLAIPLFIITGHAYGTRQRNKVWSSAETLWYDVSVKSPNNGRGLMNYGLAKMGKADYAGALDCFERALKLLPQYSYLYINMGILKSTMGKQEEAEANFKQALFLNANNPEGYFYYGNWLKSQGRYKEALEQAKSGLNASPDHIGNKNLFTDLIVILANEGDLVKTAEQNAKNNPSPEKYLSLSLTYYQNKNYEKCIEAANEALKLKPDYVEAYNNICSAQNILGNYDEAIKAGQQAMKIDPGYQLAKNNLNDGIARKAKVEAILTDIKKQPTEAKYINLSLVYYNLGSFQKCADAAQKALEYNPRSEAAYNNICSAYNMLQLWDKAIEAGENGLKINPENQLLKNNLAVSKKGKAGN